MDTEQQSYYNSHCTTKLVQIVNAIELKKRQQQNFSRLFSWLGWGGGSTWMKDIWDLRSQKVNKQLEEVTDEKPHIWHCIWNLNFRGRGEESRVPTLLKYCLAYSFIILMHKKFLPLMRVLFLFFFCREGQSVLSLKSVSLFSICCGSRMVKNRVGEHAK